MPPLSFLAAQSAQLLYPMLSLLATNKVCALFSIYCTYTVTKVCILSLMLSLLANSQGLCFIFYILYIHCYKSLYFVSNAVFVSKLTRFVAIFLYFTCTITQVCILSLMLSLLANSQGLWLYFCTVHALLHKFVFCL
jgi:hypothetical protein